MYYRVVSGGAGSALAPPEFRSSVNPILHDLLKKKMSILGTTFVRLIMLNRVSMPKVLTDKKAHGRLR